MKTVFAVVVVREIPGKTESSFENHGIFTTEEKAREIADNYNFAFTKGLVVEVTLDRETIY